MVPWCQWVACSRSCSSVPSPSSGRALPYTFCGSSPSCSSSAGWGATPSVAARSGPAGGGGDEPGGPARGRPTKGTYSCLPRALDVGRGKGDFANWTCGAVWSARRPVKPEVAGSNPVRSAREGSRSRRGACPTKVSCPPQGRVAQSEERAPEKREVTGSTPVPTTKAIGGRRVVTIPDKHHDWEAPVGRAARRTT
jgi:hypothetical protein